MELTNATPFAAAYTLNVDKDGRESLIVVVKATFRLPLDNSEPKLLEKQPPIVEADQFTGEPGFSATLYESDFAPFKAQCDVLLNGSAYTPRGQSATQVDVGLKVGNITKVFSVVGNRYWVVSGGGIGKTRPHAFTQMPISYDVAFGGVDDFHSDDAKRDAFLDNPVGRGFHRYLDGELVHNTPLPNTEEREHPITSPVGNYKPMSFGPVGRGWPQRARYAGTYDQNWVDNVFPFLPDDFDDRYFQVAPPDQQSPYLIGGEQVYLLNLTPQGKTQFTIPTLEVPVVFFKRNREEVHTQGVADTLYIEPDLERFSITWRVAQPLKKDIFEIPEVLVGNRSKAWWRARKLGKAYHASLANAVSAVNDDT